MAARFAAERKCLQIRFHRPEVHVVSDSELRQTFAARRMMNVADVPYGLRGFMDTDGIWLSLWRDTDTRWHELGHWYFGPREEEADAFMYYAADHGHGK